MLSPRSVFLLFILVAVGICETFGLRLFLVDKAGNLKDVASNSNASLVHGEAFLDLACVADGPVEWIYEGGGKPSKVKEITRRRPDHKVKSMLHFAIGNNSYDYVHHSGRYTCRLLLEPKKNSTVQVYFRGDDETPFMDASSTSGILYLPSSNLTREFVIPCLSTRPEIKPYLLRVANRNTTRVEALYDPLVGFHVTIPQEGDPLDTVVGEYACALTESLNNSMRYLVYPPKIKAYPEDPILYVGKSINLTCEYPEPVVIKETESNLPVYGSDEDVSMEEEIEESTETIPTSTHVANYIDTDPIPGSFGEFQCVTENAEKRVLHTWQYFVIGKEADELSGIKFNKKKEEFKCRSKVNQPGLLSFIHCATPSECAINTKCLQKSDNCRGYKAPLKKPNHCKSGNGTPCTKIVYNGASGYVRCVAEGIDQIRSFGDKGLRSKQEFPRKLKLTLNDVAMESNALIFNVTFQRSSYHFIEGHRWSFSNGNSTHQENLTAVETKQTRDISYAQLRIPVESSKFLRIQSHVPLRNSMEWETLTLTVEPSDLPDLSIVEDSPARSTEDSVDPTEAAITESDAITDGSVDNILTTTLPTDIEQF